MSVWTSVSGNIVFDAESFKSREVLVSELGRTVDHKSTQEELEKCTVPCGSERSLQYSVSQCPKNTSYPWVVSFWGNLRDFGGRDGRNTLLNYFNGIIKNRAVDSAIVSIECETSEIFQYYHDSCRFEKVAETSPYHGVRLTEDEWSW